MDWDVNTALSNLRLLLGDGPTDKYEFKTDVFPTPDNVSTRFFVGQTLMVDGSLEVHNNGVLAAPDSIDPPKGCFDLSPAPSGQLQASFYYQWFTDEQLAAFLDEAGAMLQVVTDAAKGFAELVGTPGSTVSLDMGLTPSLMQFAMYNAYMFKAAEYANTLEASAQGYSINMNARHPNWRALADSAWKMGQEKLKMYTDNTAAAGTMAAVLVTYRLPIYQPL